MKILYISHSSDAFGSDNSLYDMVKSLRDEITPIVIMPQNGILTYRLDVLGIQRYVVPYDSNHHNNRTKEQEIKQLFGNLNAAFEIYELVKNLDIDIVHTNSSVCDVGAMVALLLNKPHVWHVREMVKEQFDGEYWNEAIKKILADYTSEFISISNSVRDNIFTKYNINSEVIYNAVNINNNNECDVLRKPEFLFSSGLYERKGVWDAVKAIEYLKREYKTSTKLYIAGEGSRKDKWILKKYLYKHLLEDNIEIIGFQNDLSPWRTKCQYSLTCAWNEALGRTTIEAMLSGMIPIGANTAGTKEIIGDDSTRGFLYKSKDFKDLARVIKEALDMEESNKNELIENAKSYVNDTFSSEKYAKNMLELYEKVYDESIDRTDDYSKKIIKSICENLQTIANEEKGTEIAVNALWYIHYLKKSSIAKMLSDEGHNSIGIYGMGDYGQKVYDELAFGGINIEYVKDRNAGMISEIENTVLEDEDLPPDVFCLIAIAKGWKEIKERLDNMGISNISLYELLSSDST